MPQTEISQIPPLRRYNIGAAQFEAQTLSPGLHLVATPIGNLGDITVRALATLAAADTILCEDTRTTAKLLTRYAIKTRLSPYHEHNAAKVRPHILERLARGAAIALVSDAGMPLISDPGYRLVSEAVSQAIPVTACPGPSAVLTGLALSGLPTDRFAYFGFLPAKAGERKRLYAELTSLPMTLIFFESPHRILGTLGEMAEGLPGRSFAMTRELTKLHEEVLRGSPAEIAAILGSRESVKGEITLIASPPSATVTAATDADILANLATMPAARAAADIAKRFNVAKKDIYARILALKDHD